MPIYEYRCDRGHTFEVVQRMSDEPVTVCTSCDARVQRVMHPVAVHFKGSGFYTTDYARKSRTSDGDSSDTDSKNGSDKAGSTSTKSDKGDKAETTAKPASAKKSDSSD